MQRRIELNKEFHTIKPLKVLESILNRQPHPLGKCTDASIYERNLISVSHNLLLFNIAKVHIPFIFTNILQGKMFVAPDRIKKHWDTTRSCIPVFIVPTQHQLHQKFYLLVFIPEVTPSSATILTARSIEFLVFITFRE